MGFGGRRRIHAHPGPEIMHWLDGLKEALYNTDQFRLYAGVCTLA